MILIDANILLYAYDSKSLHHEKAKEWLEDALSGAEQAGLSWLVVLAFIRISTNPRLRPLDLERAVSIVSEWLARPNVVLLNPGERHWEILGNLLLHAQAKGPLAMDAHLAALAIEHGATLYSSDRDFMRFPKLRYVDPLSKP